MKLDTKDRVRENFLSIVEANSLRDCTFTSVIDAAGASRSYAYRVYPGGIESIIQDLHEDMVDQSLRSIRSAVNELEPPITFDMAVAAGIQAVTRTLAEQPLTSRVFRADRQLLRQYLTIEGDGTLVAVLGDYAANCAATFGSLNPNLSDLCRSFVWDALVELTRQLQTEDSALDELARTITDDGLGENLERLLDHLIEDINRSDGPELDKCNKRLPRAIAVPECPDAAPLRLILT